MMRWAALVAVIGGCRIKDLDLEGKACPCPADWTCDPVRQVCTKTPGDAAGDGSGSADASMFDHVTVEPGWSVHLLKDFSGVVPFNLNDFMDGTAVDPNEPNTVAALYAPFPADFAIAAGRKIIEVAHDGTTTVHDYTPAQANMAGPDAVGRMCFMSTLTMVGQLWVGAASVTGGDGLYNVSSTWAITRDQNRNNVVGVGCDATGAFDARNAATVYFVDQAALYRRDSAAMVTSLVANSMLRELAVKKLHLFTVQDPGAGGPDTMDLVTVAPTTHAAAKIASATRIDLAEGGDPDTTSVLALKNQASLVIYSDTGAEMPIAASTDPAWQWNAASAPQSPHPRAGGYVVMESNRTTNQDHLLLFTSP